MGVFDTIGDFLGMGVREYPDPYRERTKNKGGGFAEGYTGAEKEPAPWATAEPELGEGEEAQKYMGLSPAEWERIGGFGTSVAGKAIGAGIGAGKAAIGAGVGVGKSLLDWNLERKEQNERDREEARFVEKGREDAEIQRKSDEHIAITTKARKEEEERRLKLRETYLSGQQGRWDEESRLAGIEKGKEEEKLRLEQLEERRLKQVEDPERYMGVPGDNTWENVEGPTKEATYAELMKHGGPISVQEQERIQKEKVNKELKRKEFLKEIEGLNVTQTAEIKERAEKRDQGGLSRIEGFEGTIPMEPVPSLLGTANKQSLLNKVKEMPARFITKLTEMDQAETQREQQKSIHRQGLIDNPEMKPGYDPWSDAEGYPELQTGYDPKTGLNKLTREYWEHEQSEFKDMQGQYRILDPKNKYKDVEANPYGTKDQKAKAHLLRRAELRLSGKKWYQDIRLKKTPKYGASRKGTTELEIGGGY